MGAIAGPMLVKNALSSVGLLWVSQSTVQTSQGKGKGKRTLDACKVPPASLSLSPCLSLSSSHCSHRENAQGMNAESKLWQDRHTESKVQMQVQVILNLIS
jgi:hypothetical protein